MVKKDMKKLHKSPFAVLISSFLILIEVACQKATESTELGAANAATLLTTNLAKSKSPVWDSLGGSEVPSANAYGVAFAIGKKGYFTLGSANGSMPTELYEYNSANGVWTQKASFPGGGRVYAVGFSIGGKGYVGSGINELGQLTDDFWQ